MRPSRRLIPLTFTTLLSIGAAALAQGPGPACRLPMIQPSGSAPFDGFGGVMDLDGDELLVSGPGQQSAFLYRNVQGEWTIDHQFVHPTAVGLGTFGAGVALDEDLILVGFHGFLGLPEEVVVFERSKSSWNHVQTIADPAANGLSDFGSVMAMDDGQAMIGGVDAVYVYAWSGAKFKLTQTITGVGDFGASIAMCGNHAIIGARLDDQLAPDAGAAHLYRRSEGVWKKAQTLSAADFAAADANANDRFGNGVALNETHAVVGAPGDDDFAVDCGSAYVFRFVGDPALLKAQTEIHGHLPLVGDQFGTSVAINRVGHAEIPRIIVGAPSNESPGFDNAGAHVFRAPPTDTKDWIFQARLKDNCSYSENSNFGASVAITEKEMALVGSSYTLQPVVAGGAIFPFSLATSAGFLCDCPCNNAADHSSYGSGKAGTNGVPVLESFQLPVLGKKSGLALSHARPGALPILFLGTKPASIPFDEGHLLVSNPFVLTIPIPVPASGTLTITDGVPADAALCGVSIYHQMMFVDPGASGPYQTAQTQGLERTFGS